jgi:hypothetical protein
MRSAGLAEQCGASCAIAPGGFEPPPHDNESCTGCERRRNGVTLGQGPPGNRANRRSIRAAAIAGLGRNCRRLVDVVGAPIGLPMEHETALGIGRLPSMARTRSSAGLSHARFHAEAEAPESAPRRKPTLANRLSRGYQLVSTCLGGHESESSWLGKPGRTWIGSGSNRTGSNSGSYPEAPDDSRW